MEHSFDFISDPLLQQIIIRDYSELQQCINSKSYKSVMLLSGSIIEAILLDYFKTFPPVKSGIDIKPNVTLNELIDLAVKESVINDNDKNLVTVLRNYRNLIHPEREIRSTVEINAQTASISNSLLDLFVTKIVDRQSKNGGYKANQILSKLINDHNFHSIYNMSILKLNKHQQILLFRELVEYDMQIKKYWRSLEDPVEPYALFHNPFIIDKSELACPKKFIEPLKSKVPEYLINDYLKQLVLETETGVAYKTVSLYHLFDEELHMLNEHDIDTVICYLLDLFKVLHDTNDAYSVGLYNKIGQYITTKNTMDALVELINYSVSNFTPKTCENGLKALYSLLLEANEDSVAVVCSTLQSYYDLWLADKVNFKHIAEDFFNPALDLKIIVINEQKISICRY